MPVYKTSWFDSFNFIQMSELELYQLQGTQPISSFPLKFQQKNHLIIGFLMGQPLYPSKMNEQILN